MFLLKKKGGGSTDENRANLMKAGALAVYFAALRVLYMYNARASS